jgi:uncharacterized membrane protein
VRSKVKLLGHPVHPMLVAFPVAFYTGTAAAFIVYAASQNLFWFRLAVVLNCAGVVMAVLAALPGFVDWLLAIPNGTQAKSTGLKHMALNVLALAVFTVNGAIQLGQWNSLTPGAAAGIVLSLLGVGLTIGAGFLGWSLVQNYHIGVDLNREQERFEPNGQPYYPRSDRPFGEQPPAPPAH